MELSELVYAFSQLVNAEKDDLPEAVYRALLSEQKNDILSAYIELVGGSLQTDELQRIFQYYYADRKEKCQDYTPASIAKLCAEVTESGGKVVYDLCAGSGALTIQKWVKNPNKIFICEELDERVIPFLLFNLAVRNISGFVINRNALTLDCIKCFELKSGERFSDITKTEVLPDIKADEIVSNPPYNIKWEAPVPLTADERFQKTTIPPSSNANYAFILTALNRLSAVGKCAFVLPNGVLDSALEKEIREYLLNEGLVERIIILPGKMFEATPIGTCVIVFSHSNKFVGFFDCRQKAIEERRDQKGQFGGASHENRTYHKTVKILPDNVISAVCGKCEDVPEFSAKISVEDIAQNDYTLVPSRYIKFEYRETRHRPYEDIMADINRISRERSVIKITCNQSLAKELQLDRLISQDEEASHIDLTKTSE